MKSPFTKSATLTSLACAALIVAALYFSHPWQAPRTYPVPELGGGK